MGSSRRHVDHVHDFKKLKFGKSINLKFKNEKTKMVFENENKTKQFFFFLFFFWVKNRKQENKTKIG